MKRTSPLCLVAVVLAGCSFRAGALPAGSGDGGPDAPRDSTSGNGDVLADATVDAMPDATPVCEDVGCGFAGGLCMSGTCVIDNDTQFPVVCPSNMPCKVICNASSACKGGVNCGSATSCDVTCFGSSTCQDTGVDCGSALTCKVSCNGSSACQHGFFMNQSVECRDAICEVTCQGASACADGIDVDNGTCTSHCCQGACSAGTDTCTNDNVCQ